MHVLVHGGAGGSPDEPVSRQAALEDAARTGSTAESPVEAVETAVRQLEASPRFNAGVGGAVQSDGVIRTDAGIMTDDREVGAVCSMPGVEHAVTVARVVMTETPHVFVSGEHAVSLADAYGVRTDVDLWSDRTRERWDESTPPSGGVRSHLECIRDRFGRTDPGGREGDGEALDSDGNTDADRGDDHPDLDHDTVGAVAFDGERLAAATSTGGRWLALAGRVGDVPQVGAGYYCCPAAAVSATGAGEDIARVTLSRRAARHVEGGLEAQTACDLAIEEFAEHTGSSAGVIAVDSSGAIGSAFNSEEMQTAYAHENR